ncbi:MAG: ScyD/ScyE family protein [Chloroflexi bacterium]|nr:ScyD/ScyE family protein [Chloroflexota bacterium]
MLKLQRKHQSLIWTTAVSLLILLAACQKQPEAPQTVTPQVEVVAEGLLAPIGMAALPDGSLLIAEDGTGHNDDSAGISLMTPGGEIGRFISGFESSLDSGDLTGSPLVGISPDGRTLYVGNYEAGHLWTYPLPDEPLTLPAQPLTADDLGQAMQPLNNVRLRNPFDITFDPKGIPIVTDSTENGVAKETEDGRTRFIHRFDDLVDPTNDKLRIDPVPTGIARIGAEYYVTLTGGCPFPPGGGELVVIDEQRNQRTIADNLNMPIDVAQGPDDTIWVLEFATFTPDASCFSGMGYQQKTGRLSRLQPDGTLEPVVTELNYPGAVLPMPDGSLYVTEVFNGRLLRITFTPENPTDAANPIPTIVPVTPAYKEIGDMDGALTAVAQRLNLQPYPGATQKEGDTPLARLGQDLFFDPLLSGDQNIACATCHYPALAMADGRVLPIGTGGEQLGPARDFVEQVALAPDAANPRKREGQTDPETGLTLVPNPFMGQFVPRNSPTVLNAALFPAQFWDGRVQQYANQPVQTQEELVNQFQMDDALATQALFPLISLHEMAGATLGNLPAQEIRRQLIERLVNEPAYRQKFTEVFGSDTISTVQIAEAIAAFERRFIYTAAPWDDYLAGDKSALTDQQKRGALLFFGELNPAVNCAQCHSGDLFTDMQYYNLLVPQLGPGKGVGDNGREDWGRSLVTYDRRDQYKFRTPSLRNVILTAPYFHTGAYATLEAVIRHHANIWESAANYDPSAHLPPAYYSSVRPFEPEKQGHSAAPQLQNGLPLSDQDVADLVAFLRSLTDPAAADLSAFIPESVPSGLPLDPTPEPISQSFDAAQDKSPISNPQSPISPLNFQFTDATTDANLQFQNDVFATATFDDPAAMMGSGLCWLDYDNDGWLDLYLLNSYAEEEVAYWQANGGLPQNALFRNENGRFQDVSAASQTNLSMRGNACLAGDFNNDGWTDLFLTADGPNALLWNNGNGTFTEGAAAAGVADEEWNSTAVAADLNNDGWVDIFVGSFIDLDYQIPRPTGAFPGDYYGLPDHLYLNNGDGTFRDVAKEAGLERDERALGAIFSDLDLDGDLDLYIANDGQANRLYEYEPVPNDPNGLGFRFVERTQEAEVGDTGSGMGVASADYDGDGLPDLFVTNWEAELNAIYRNETAEAGDLNFRYSTYRIGMRGLGNNMTGWGTMFADFDHDTDVDLLTVNGRVPVTNWETDPELVRLYGNRLAEGFPGEFREWTQLVGLKEVGPLIARGAAAADFDNDGDLDVAINQIGGTAVLLRNDGGNENGAWLEVGFDGFYPGARVTVILPDGRELIREWHAGSSYQSSEDPRLHFGLGDAEIVTVLVRWPDGTAVRLENVPANQIIFPETWEFPGK